MNKIPGIPIVPKLDWSRIGKDYYSGWFLLHKLGPSYQVWIIHALYAAFVNNFRTLERAQKYCNELQQTHNQTGRFTG
jgi:hypothetical protein